MLMAAEGESLPRGEFDPRSVTYSKQFQIRQTSGDPSAVAPPVPIPNTEVKRCSPDDSASIGCAKVGRRQSYAPCHGNMTRGFFVSAHHCGARGAFNGG